MLQICRTCLYEIQDSNFFTLSNNNAVAVIIKNQLAFCVPEMVPDMVSDPIMCHACVAALHSAFDFKYRCLQSEERIRNYVQSNRIHNSTAAINLVEMFSYLYGEVCENTFAAAVQITQDTQLVTNFDTLLDDKHEPVSMDEDEVQLAKTDADTLGNYFIEVCEKSATCRLPNEDAVPAEICTLERLCSSEELQLHFNCIFIEQSRSEKATYIENELSLGSIIPTDNGSYNLEDWNRFEERFISSENTSMEDDREEDGSYSNVTSSYDTVQLRLRGNEKIAAVNKKNEENNFSRSSVKRCGRIGAARGKITAVNMKNKKSNCSHSSVRFGQRRRIGAASDKIIMQTNPKSLLKSKKVSYKKLEFVKPVKTRKSKAVKNLFKCSECKYTTKFQIDLELHSVGHIEINDYKCEMKAQQCTTTHHGEKTSKHNKGYEYVRYDYPKRKAIIKSDKC